MNISNHESKHAISDKYSSATVVYRGNKKKWGAHTHVCGDIDFVVVAHNTFSCLEVIAFDPIHGIEASNRIYLNKMKLVTKMEDHEFNKNLLVEKELLMKRNGGISPDPRLVKDAATTRFFGDYITDRLTATTPSTESYYGSHGAHHASSLGSGGFMVELAAIRDDRLGSAHSGLSSEVDVVCERPADLHPFHYDGFTSAAAQQTQQQQPRRLHEIGSHGSEPQHGLVHILGGTAAQGPGHGTSAQPELQHAGSSSSGGGTGVGARVRGGETGSGLTSPHKQQQQHQHVVVPPLRIGAPRQDLHTPQAVRLSKHVRSHHDDRFQHHPLHPAGMQHTATHMNGSSNREHVAASDAVAAGVHRQEHGSPVPQDVLYNDSSGAEAEQSTGEAHLPDPTVRRGPTGLLHDPGSEPHQHHSLFAASSAGSVVSHRGHPHDHHGASGRAGADFDSKHDGDSASPTKQFQPPGSTLSPRKSPVHLIHHLHNQHDQCVQQDEDCMDSSDDDHSGSARQGARTHHPHLPDDSHPHSHAHAYPRHHHTHHAHIHAAHLQAGSRVEHAHLVPLSSGGHAQGQGQGQGHSEGVQRMGHMGSFSDGPASAATSFLSYGGGINSNNASAYSICNNAGSGRESLIIPLDSSGEHNSRTSSSHLSSHQQLHSLAPISSVAPHEGHEGGHYTRHADADHHHSARPGSVVRPPAGTPAVQQRPAHHRDQADQHHRAIDAHHRQQDSTVTQASLGNDSWLDDTVAMVSDVDLSDSAARRAPRQHHQQQGQGQREEQHEGIEHKDSRRHAILRRSIDDSHILENTGFSVGLGGVGEPTIATGGPGEGFIFQQDTTPAAVALGTAHLPSLEDSIGGNHWHGQGQDQVQATLGGDGPAQPHHLFKQPTSGSLPSEAESLDGGEHGTAAHPHHRHHHHHHHQDQRHGHHNHHHDGHHDALHDSHGQHSRHSNRLAKEVRQQRHSATGDGWAARPNVGRTTSSSAAGKGAGRFGGVSGSDAEWARKSSSKSKKKKSRLPHIDSDLIVADADSTGTESGAGLGARSDNSSIDSGSDSDIESSIGAVATGGAGAGHDHLVAPGVGRRFRVDAADTHTEYASGASRGIYSSSRIDSDRVGSTAAASIAGGAAEGGGGRGRHHLNHLPGLKVVKKVGSFKYSEDSEYKYADDLLSKHDGAANSPKNQTSGQGLQQSGQVRMDPLPQPSLHPTRRQSRGEGKTVDRDARDDERALAGSISGIQPHQPAEGGGGMQPHQPAEGGGGMQPHKPAEGSGGKERAPHAVGRKHAALTGTIDTAKLVATSGPDGSLSGHPSPSLGHDSSNSGSSSLGPISPLKSPRHPSSSSAAASAAVVHDRGIGPHRSPRGSLGGDRSIGPRRNPRGSLGGDSSSSSDGVLGATHSTGAECSAEPLPNLDISAAAAVKLKPLGAKELDSDSTNPYLHPEHLVHQDKGKGTKYAHLDTLTGEELNQIEDILQTDASKPNFQRQTLSSVISAVRHTDPSAASLSSTARGGGVEGSLSPQKPAFTAGSSDSRAPNLPAAFASSSSPNKLVRSVSPVHHGFPSPQNRQQRPPSASGARGSRGSSPALSPVLSPALSPSPSPLPGTDTGMGVGMGIGKGSHPDSSGGGSPVTIDRVAMDRACDSVGGRGVLPGVALRPLISVNANANTHQRNLPVLYAPTPAGGGSGDGSEGGGGGVRGDGTGGEWAAGGAGSRSHPRDDSWAQAKSHQ